MPENQNSERIPEELAAQNPDVPVKAQEVSAAADTQPVGSAAEIPDENKPDGAEVYCAEPQYYPEDEDVRDEDVRDEDVRKERSPVGFVVRIALILLAICGVVTLLLATVNYITKDRIAANKAEEMNLAIQEIFPDCDASKAMETGADDSVKGIYQVLHGDQTIGYAVSVVSSGFGGDIEMLVGIGAGGKITGVQILSLSETPGVGSRVNDPDYLSGYQGKSGNLVLKQDVDAVSGATISSRAVLAGVNAALGADLDFSQLAEPTIGDDETTGEVLDPDRDFPADPGLETGHVDGEVPALEIETMYREETKAPETKEDETELVDLVTRTVEDTEPDAETTGTSSGETTEPVSTDDVPESAEPAGDEITEPADSDSDA